MIIERRGNIFTSNAQSIVNTVNCVGVMGAGIAFEFRLRYPQMYVEYQKFCEQGLIEIGKLWRYKANDREILAFPTKKDWRTPSKEEYLHQGLQKFVATYRSLGINSVAFPLLGADKGGISPQRAFEIMRMYLDECDIEVEIWYYDPKAKDDKYESLKALLQSLDKQTISKESGIALGTLNKIYKGVESPSISSLSGLLKLKGVGEKSLEKLFAYVESKGREVTLFSYLEK